MAKYPYEHKWTKGDPIGKGGQGLTYSSQLKGEDVGLYALKILKEQRNQERRGRMFMEVAALRALQHPNIPKYFDSNADEFENNQVDLYLVTEYVSGLTLQDFINTNGVLKLPDAVTFTLRLTEILAYCHLKNYCHRDIKPDNIIIRNDDIGDPVLIDFGLSFNEEIIKNETPSWQHIGNRFLALPELRVVEGNKKDRRSDITMLCGVFLFCLTGIHPTDLLDETSTKPHRRDKSKTILQDLDRASLNALNKFFDIAFNVGINDRWQSAEAVRTNLIDFQSIKPSNEMDESDVSKKLEAYKKSISERQDFKQLENLKVLFKKYDETIRRICQSVLHELESIGFGNIQGGHSIDLSKQTFTNSVGITHPNNKKLNFFPKFTCYVNGSEIVLEATEDGRTNEFLRYPLNEEINWSSLENSLRTYYIDGITSKKE
jgi:eukaryotic-like serine/threonine-protein kinase